ncbi:hypothetical protein [Colwellia sp. 12G3]|uniref:hypothetical protein n=1 Tax=Colwellia sp. 12G3 TaxID=2058299 RepID=UPI000C34F0CB|nr:hypothetical protein [Colwellia sp. 12G3]PKI17711.1 hypothetical protein CXF71_02675 [Colwellia sp. 12G3]
MKNTTMKTILLMLSILAISNVSAQQYIFPKNGQTKEQQQQDEYSCHSFAVSETGFDPTAVQAPVAATAPQPSAQPAPQRKSGLRGALKGAAAGALIAEVGGNDVSNGAAKGAAVGVVSSGRHNAKAASQAAEQQKSVEQQAQQQAAQAQQLSDEKLNNYNKARNVCLDAKGYSVSG